MIHAKMDTPTPSNEETNIIGLCIPKVDSLISSDFIRSKLKMCNLGRIRQYTELTWKNDPTQKRILIRIEWNTSLPHSVLWREQLRHGNPLRIVYEYPYEWKMYLAKN